MPLRRFLSRRWLLAFLGGAALLVGLAMLHPYPRQSLFGPTIRGKPWCVWEAAFRRQAHWEEYQETLDFRLRGWLGIRPSRQEWEFKHPELAPLLVHMTYDPDPAIRDEAIHYLHMVCHDREVFQHIVPLANHPDESVRVAAMFMMMNFRDRSLPILMEALDDPAEDVRWQAACQLEVLGPVAKEAIPALQRRSRDESKEVQFIAARALQTIDPDRFHHLKSEREIE